MPETQFAVYILTTRRRTVLYTGVTSDLARRMEAHRAGVGSRFTRRYSVTKLVYVEVCLTARQAIAREKQLKGGSRAAKIALIEGQNPEWLDLSETAYVVARSEATKQSGG